MGTETIRRVLAIPSKKQGIPEKQQYRRHLWNMLFVEILLQKLQEREQDKHELSITWEQEKGQETATSWHMGRDSLELSFYCFERWLNRADYAYLAGAVRRANKIAEDRIFCEAQDIMKKYYDGAMDTMTLAAIYYQYCDASIQVDAKEDIEHIYECFVRANATCAATHNRWEGKQLVEECGLSWAGTTYYNSYYYYKEKEVRNMFLEIAEETGLTSDRTVISFHEVFEWLQARDNFPVGQYGLREKNMEPPKHFVYLYRNGYGASEKKGITRLKHAIKQRINESGIFRYTYIQGGAEYHNGMSYLIQQKKKTGRDERIYEEGMQFLRNFRLYRISGCVEVLGMWK